MNTNQDWEAWGEFDPLYGVATIPGKSKTDPGAWTTEEFLELGGSDWDLFRSRWEEYGLSRRSCLEIGCGAGRVTYHLARNFDLTHAVDVSADMIRSARHHVDPEHVTFHVIDGVHLPLADGEVAAVFSTHVFQHFASTDQAAEVFREVCRVMEPGGTLMIHLPFIAWPYGRTGEVHRLVETAATWARHAAVWAKRAAYRRGLRKTPASYLTSYEVGWLERTLDRIGFRDIEIRIIFGDSAMGHMHPFVFARKPVS